MKGNFGVNRFVLLRFGEVADAGAVAQVRRHVVGSNHSERRSRITKMGKGERKLDAPHWPRDTRLILVIYHQSTAMKCSGQVKHGAESEDFNCGEDFTCRRDVGSSLLPCGPSLWSAVHDVIIISLNDCERQEKERIGHPFCKTASVFYFLIEVGLASVRLPRGLE